MLPRVLDVYISWLCTHMTNLGKNYVTSCTSCGNTRTCSTAVSVTCLMQLYIQFVLDMNTDTSAEVLQGSGNCIGSSSANANGRLMMYIGAACTLFDFVNANLD